MAVRCDVQRGGRGRADEGKKCRFKISPCEKEKEEEVIKKSGRNEKGQLIG